MYVPSYDLVFNFDYNLKSFQLIRGGFFLRIIAVMVVASLLTFTTSTIELNDGLESLMKPLRIIKIPTYIFLNDDILNFKIYSLLVEIKLKKQT